MKRIRLIILGGALTLIGLICASSQTQPSMQTPQTAMTSAQRQQIALERTVNTQQRLNRYFHNDVMPNLKNCWSRVQGKGTIAVKYNYAKSANGRWVFDKLETDNSTLPRQQQAVAIRCMQDAVRGTSFPVEGTESSQDSFLLVWNWPIPFPANAAQLTTAMFAAIANSGGDGDGCDGHGAPAKCYTCSGKDGSCLRVCVGIDVPCTVRFDAANKITGCRVAGNSCASGGLFGVSGGSRVIY